MKDVIGIDISKDKFDVALSVKSRFKFKKFNNNSNGLIEFDEWLKMQGVIDTHACMEATGNYSDLLAHHLYDSGIKVSVVNPARIKGFALSELTRTKTDKADAHLIARFCQALNPDLWQPKEPHIRSLRHCVRHLQALQCSKQDGINRRDSSKDTFVVESVNKIISIIDNEINETKRKIKTIIASHSDLNKKHELLTTIPGIGEATIAVILGFIGEPNDFERAKDVSAFLGLNPRHNQSGSSVKGATHISKMGDSSLRKAFYMPSLTRLMVAICSLFAISTCTRGKFFDLL